VAGNTPHAKFPRTPGPSAPACRGARIYHHEIAGIALLVIDKDGIDDKKRRISSPIFMSTTSRRTGVRAQLRFFAGQVGQTITLPAGAIGGEGWFALKTIPASWAQAGGAAGSWATRGESRGSGRRRYRARLGRARLDRRSGFAPEETCRT